MESRSFFGSVPNSNRKQSGTWIHHRDGEIGVEKQSIRGNELGPSGACTAAKNQDHVMQSSAAAATDGDEMLEKIQ